MGGLLVQTTVASGVKEAASYDGNGNIVTWTKSNATAPTARREYDAFGNTVVSEGAWPSSFGFSTKIQDAETGLYYYGYRFYDPVTGRWPSRDPIGESGGMNLYGFVGNDGVNKADMLGLLLVEYPEKKVPQTVDGNLVLGIARYDFSSYLIVRQQEGKKCCLIASIKGVGSQNIILDRSRIAAQPHPNNDVNRIIHHEMRHHQATWNKIEYIGKRMENEQKCYESPEDARKAAKEIERFFGDDWLDRLMGEEGEHIDSRNFGTPRNNEY